MHLISDPDHYSRAFEAAAGIIRQELGPNADISEEDWIDKDDQDVSADTDAKEEIEWFTGDQTDYELRQPKHISKAKDSIGGDQVLCFYGAGLLLETDAGFTAAQIQEVLAEASRGYTELYIGSKLRAHLNNGNILMSTPSVNHMADGTVKTFGAVVQSTVTPFGDLKVVGKGNKYELRTYYPGDAWTNTVDFELGGYLRVFRGYL